MRKWRVIAKKTSDDKKIKCEKKGRDGGRKIERVTCMRFSLLSFQSNISPTISFLPISFHILHSSSTLSIQSNKGTFQFTRFLSMITILFRSNNS